MKNFTALLLGTSLVLTVSSCANKNLVHLQGYRFRTNASFSAELGSLGVRRLDGPNRFEKIKTPEWKDLEVRKLARVSKSVREMLSKQAGLQLEDIAKASGRSNLQREEKIELELFEIRDIEKLRREINQDPDLLELVRRTNDSRIVTRIALVYNHARYRNIADSLDVSLSLDVLNSNPRLIAKRNRAVVDTLKISDGAIFAYTYARFCWGNDGHIGDVLEDGTGSDDECKKKEFVFKSF